MDITFPEKNPYLSHLRRDAREAEEINELELVCSVLEYVDSVQVAALLNDEEESELTTNQEVTKDDLLVYQSSELTTAEIIEELREKYGSQGKK